MKEYYTALVYAVVACLLLAVQVSYVRQKIHDARYGTLIEQRCSLYMNVFGGTMRSSVEISTVIPRPVYTQSRLWRKAGNGWFSYLGTCTCPCAQVWIEDVANMLMGYKSWLGTVFLMTVIVVRMHATNSMERIRRIQEHITAVKCAGQAGRVRMLRAHAEVHGSFLLVWYDGLLDQESIELLLAHTRACCAANTIGNNNTMPQ